MEKDQKEIFLYPQNMKAKPMLIVWYIKDIVIWTVGLLLGVFLFVTSNTYFIIIPLIYAIMTITLEDVSIFNYLRFLLNFFFFNQQQYLWGREKTRFNAVVREKKVKKEDK